MATAGTTAGRGPLLPAGLIVLLLAIGVGQTLGFEPWPWLSVAVFLVLVGAGLRRLGRVARILLAVLLLAGLVSALNDFALFAEATQSAAFLVSLIAALLLLGRIVGRAPDVRRCAELLVSQPQGTRYLAITLGSHLLSIILNFGAIVLVAAFMAPQRETLERQGATIPLTLAMLRGFAAMPMWSPLALSVLITLSLIPEVSYWRILPICLCAAALYTAAGIALDRRGPASRGTLGPRSGSSGAPAAARPVVLRVLARTVGLVGGVIALHWASGLAMINSVFVLILGVLLWTWLAEAINHSTPSSMTSDLGAVGREGVNELIILATAAFVGTVMTHYLHGMNDGVALAGRPTIAALTALVPAAMVVSGTFAINPILSGTVLIGALKPIWPEAALHILALAVILGWGVTAAGTPFTANVLIAARSMDVRPGVLAFEGNGSLTLLALSVVGLAGAIAVYTL